MSRQARPQYEDLPPETHRSVGAIEGAITVLVRHGVTDKQVLDVVRAALREARKSDSDG